MCDGGGQVSATAVVKAPPRGTGVHVCEIISSHHVSVAFLAEVRVVSCMMKRKIPPQEGVCILFFCRGCSCAYVFMQQGMERSV